MQKKTRFISSEHAHPKKFWSTFNFYESVWTYKKTRFISSAHCWVTVNFRVQSSDWPHPFLTMSTQKISNHLLICVNLYQHVKNQLTPSLHSWDTVNFRVQSSDWPHPFLTMSTPKISNHLLICVNLYQHVKNQLTPSLHSWDTVNFRVQRPDCPQPFLTMPNQQLFDTFNFWECVSICKKWGCFIDLFWKNSWFICNKLLSCNVIG